MNKNNLHSTVNNYLTNSSLFKNSQKNKLVSSYVTHRNYFAQEERNNPAIHLPNMTKSKKEYNFLNSGPAEEQRNDSIKATVKKDLQGSVKNGEGSNKMESKIQEEHQLMSIQEDLSREREAELANVNERQSLQRSLHQLNREIDSESTTKIVVNYSKPSSEKDRVIQVIEDFPEANKQTSLKGSLKSSKIVKPMVDPRKQRNEQPQHDDKPTNPYLPSSTKKPQEVKLYQTQNGELTLKQIESNSFNPATPMSSMGVAQSPREEFYLTHSTIQPKKGTQHGQEMDYFLHIRKDLSGYLASVKQKLNGTCLCLQTIQYQFDGLIDKVLQLQCQKLKTMLYRIIDNEIEDFKQFQRRQFLKNKFYLMSDLYQIKCNIDLRLQQLDTFELQLRNEYKWKDTANSIIGINYNDNINFLLKKSDEIQKDIISNIDINIAEYVKSVNEDLAGSLSRGLKESIASFYQAFSEGKWKSRLRWIHNSS